MAQAPQPGHPHGMLPRDIWDSITSAVGEAFDGQKGKTVVQTVYTTQVPSGYTGPLTTKTAAADNTKTTTTAEKKETTTSAKAATTTTTPAKTTSATAKSATTTSAAKTTATAKATTTTGKTTSASTSASTSDTLDRDTSSSTKMTRTTTSETAALTLDTSTTTASATSASLTASSTSAAATASSTPTSSGGTSAGAKAGIAIGVLGGLFVVFLLVFFLFRKRKQQTQRRQLDDDEKDNGPFGDHAAIGGGAGSGSLITSVAVSSASSRLSLRPTGQFLPNFGNSSTATAGNPQQQDNYPDRRASRGFAIALQNQAPMANRGAGTSAWDRPSTSASTVSNPFGDNAERLASPNSPYFQPSAGPGGLSANGISLAVGAAGIATAGAAGNSLVRKASTRKDGPGALDLTLTPPTFGANLGTVPASPAGTEFSFTSETTDRPQGPSVSGAAIAAAGGPVSSTVHRVQLDFIPTLEDELELRAGQLVRLLHEYDDGWALCIRLDRSRQGVVPRTCLSARPVKPRPPPGGRRAGPPINTGGQPRPMGPKGPMSPMSPMGPMGPMGPQMMGQPQSPYGAPPNRPSPAASGHPQSPAMRNQPPYPTSSSQPQIPVETRQSGSSPLGRAAASRTGPIGRKPVPGQAY